MIMKAYSNQLALIYFYLLSTIIIFFLTSTEVERYLLK